MKKRLIFFAGCFLFWMLFFWTARLIFLLYHFPLSFALTGREWLAVFGYGSRMDASMTGYILCVVGILLALSTFFKGQTTAKILSIYSLVVLSVLALLVVADMELYRHWGFRLDSTPLSYLKTPKEALGSASLKALAIQIVVLVLLITAFWRGYRKVLHSGLITSKPTGWKGIPTFLFASALMFLPIRGSLGVAPMNVGFVYFHPHNLFANHAAINVVWNAGKSLMNSDKISEYHFMEEQRAEALFAACYLPALPTERLVKETRPNVIVIILESFSNRLIEPLGGLPDVTPNLNRLCKEGVVFSNFYANSDRTDKGILGILNGYPVHPVAKVINFPEKTRQLPYLNQAFSQAGYHTAFVSGFDILYSNIAAYLGNAGYDQIISREGFPPETYRGTKWGVPDHWVFEKLLETCNQTHSPFFCTFFSLSSHEPFEVPMPTVIEGSDDEHLFLNSVYYTDRSLGAFIEAARQTDWWENTLIVITADHGSRHPGNIPYYMPQKFHIPMLWLGGAVIKKDTVITTISGQTDIPLTLLHQLGWETDRYRFSKDILGAPQRPFAYYVYNDGFGLVSDQVQIAYDNVGRRLIFEEGTAAAEWTEMGQAYLQVFSKDFIMRDRIKK